MAREWLKNFDFSESGSDKKLPFSKLKEDYAVSSSGGSIQHPYAAHMTEWNALKADAAGMGLADNYGLPTQQYYAYKGKPQWMIADDEADRQRTAEQYPAAQAAEVQKSPALIDFKSLQVTNPEVTPYKQTRALSYTDWLNQSTTNGNMGGGSGAQFAPKEDKEVTWKDLYPAYVDRAMQNVSYPAYDTAPQGDNTTLAGRIATASTMDELNQLEGEVNLMNPSAGVVYRGGSRAGGVYDQRVKSENAEQFSLLDRIAKRKEWLQGINADTVNKKYQNPLSLLQTEHEQKNKEITGRYDAEITPDQRLAYLQSLGYSSEEEAMADPDYYLKSANLPAQWAQQEIFDTGRENIDYLKKYQSTSDMRDITKNGLAETPSEFARVEYVTQTENDKVRDIEGPYDSPFFQPNNGLYEDYNPSKSTMEGYTKNFINSEIQKWQGRYDDLAADESGVKASGNQDAISEWKFRMATASYNLANAKGQLLLMNPDAKSRVDAAKTSTENPVAHPEEVRNATQAWFNLPLKLAEADANEIYNLSDAMYPSEKQIYNYLYGDGSGKAEADAYFESIRSSVEFRAAQKRQEKTAERGGSLLNIPETFPKQIYGTASTIGTSIGAALAGKDVNPYDPRFGQSREVEQLRTQVIQAAPAVTQGPLSAAISLGDMATAFSVGGGVTGMSVIMSSEAGAGTVLETLDNGGDIQTAVLNGMGSAAVEYFTERLGTGERFMNLFKNPGSVENFMKTFAKSFGAEAVEEVPGWLYGQVTDSMLLGAKSEYNRALVYYADTMGLSPEQAEKKADQDAMAQLFNQMYAAGLAGAAGGGVAYVAGNINAGNVSKDLQGRIDISPKSADAISRAMVMGEEIPADALSEYQAAITGQANAPESVLQSELNGREPDRQNVVEPNFYDEAFAQTADNAPESPVQRVNDVEAPTYPTVDMEAAGANFAPSRNPFTTKAATDTGMVTVEGISSVGSGAKVKLSDGSTAPVADMEFDDSGMGSLYRVAAAFSSPTEANTFLGFYEGSNLPAASYMQGYMDYYTAGSQGRPVSTLNGSIYAALLDEDTRQFAYTQGRATRQTAAKTAWGDFYTDIKEGQSGVVKAYIRKNMNNEQKAKLTLLDQNAKRFGLQIVVSDTLGANNGMYGGGRTVYVGLDAIDGGITKAASHEFLHYVREQDEGSYTELKNIILDAVGQEKINTRIQEEIKRHADAGIDLTEDGALEELVAQGLPDVILNTKTAERMARENLPLAKKLAAWLRDFVKRWNETFKGSPEAEALRKRGDKYEQALKAFEGALEKVKAETVTESNGQSIEEGKAAEAVKNSLKSADTTDSEGNPLTPEQVEFFKDSKVRDENGALIPVYHGTPNEFTAFDNSFANRVKAFFFSDKIEAGKTYGNRVVEAYLNLNTPLVVDAKGENWQEVKFKFDDDLYPVRTTVDRLAEHAKKSGYDGLIVLNVRDNSTKSYSEPGMITLDSHQTK
jgi:hypothetical protein